MQHYSIYFAKSVQSILKMKRITTLLFDNSEQFTTFVEKNQLKT